MATKQMTTVQCRYPGCLHGGVINKDFDEFVRIGKSNYYHKDCYKEMSSKKNAIEKQARELKSFEQIWYEKINRTVNTDELTKMLNGYISRGVSSEQLLFTLIYVVEHKLSLHRPSGFKYYVDMVEIKDAYMRKKQRERIAKAIKETNEASSKAEDKSDAPTFSLVQNKKDKLSSLFTRG